jgi:polysaccharide export outer membrane protein
MNTTIRNDGLKHRNSRWDAFGGWAARLVSAASVAAFLGLAGCAGSSDMQTLSPQASAPQYRLGPGDRLSITVFGEETMTGEYDVDDTGAVSVPLAGRVPANNMTPAQFESELTSRLSRTRLVANPQVAVSVVKYRPFFILGEVKNPGAYAYYSGATVLSAVAMAGGYTYRAQTGQIEVVRSEGSDREPRLADEDVYLQPGDVVVVPLRWF